VNQNTDCGVTLEESIRLLRRLFSVLAEIRKIQDRIVGGWAAVSCHTVQTAESSAYASGKPQIPELALADLIREPPLVKQQTKELRNDIDTTQIPPSTLFTGLLHFQASASATDAPVKYVFYG